MTRETPPLIQGFCRVILNPAIVCLPDSVQRRLLELEELERFCRDKWTAVDYCNYEGVIREYEAGMVLEPGEIAFFVNGKCKKRAKGFNSFDFLNESERWREEEPGAALWTETVSINDSFNKS